MWGSQFVTVLCCARFIIMIIIHHPSWLISSGIIQDLEDDPSCTPMASSSKQNTSKLGVKESEEESNAPSLNAKTEALHAFRTITTMLIQSKRSTAGNWPKLGCQEKILLQLLAAILVRNNGVITVTARPYDGSGKVEVLASYLGNRNSLTISQPWSPGQLINLIWNVSFSQNPCDSTIKQWTMVDPEKSVPEFFKNPLSYLTLFLPTYGESSNDLVESFSVGLCITGPH